MISDLFNMNDFLGFIASPVGRAARIALGYTLVASSLATSDKLTLRTLGIVPLVAGLFDWCVLAPVVNKPFEGTELRRSLKAHAIVSRLGKKVG
ncbi:hypothetical protein GCM10028817_36470 [Spirosoma pomorum]